jgi:hypothetical protein
MFAMICWLYEVWSTGQIRCDAVNSEYNVLNSKCEHSSYPQLFFYSIIYQYKTHI